MRSSGPRLLLAFCLLLSIRAVATPFPSSTTNLIKAKGVWHSDDSITINGQRFTIDLSTFNVEIRKFVREFLSERVVTISARRSSNTLHFPRGDRQSFIKPAVWYESSQLLIYPDAIGAHGNLENSGGYYYLNMHLIGANLRIALDGPLLDQGTLQTFVAKLDHHPIYLQGRLTSRLNLDIERIEADSTRDDDTIPQTSEVIAYGKLVRDADRPRNMLFLEYPSGEKSGILNVDQRNLRRFFHRTVVLQGLQPIRTGILGLSKQTLIAPTPKVNCSNDIFVTPSDSSH
jgi:hypothetical protein